MANEINNLRAFLRAFARHFALGKRGSSKSARPARDLPILLLPNPDVGLTGSDRKRSEKKLPYTIGRPKVEPVPAPPPPPDQAVTAKRPALKLPQDEKGLRQLNPHAARWLA